MTICYFMDRCLVLISRGEKVNVWSMKHCGKVKVKQVITLQMSQQLKTKNINVVPGRLFFRQCKAKFLLDTDSLH